MTNAEEHELRLSYLDVLLKNGCTLDAANRYFERVMRFEETKELARRGAVREALEETKSELTKGESVLRKTLDIDADALRRVVKKQNLKPIDSKWPDESREQLEEHGEKVKRDLQSVKESQDLLTAVEIKIPPKVEQKSFNFVNPEVSVKEGNGNTVPQQSAPKMVDPRGSNEITETKKKVEGGIRETKSERMGRSKEIPLRYEDRIKQAQK